MRKWSNDNLRQMEIRYMAYKNSYIKEVENYFLFLVGKGVMLSYKDYDLIMKWKKRGVPKEVVYKGISKALDNRRRKKGSNKPPRSLTQCASFVEEEIRSYRSIKEGESPNLELSKNDITQRIADRLAKLVTSEKREKIRRHYIEARKRVLGLRSCGENEAIISLERIEKDFYDDFFQTLPEPERERIKLEAENMIGKRSRFMSEKARRESVLSFRDEILKKDYELKSIFSDD